MTTRPAASNSSAPLLALHALLVAGEGSAEPRSVAAALGRVPAADRQAPICRFADAVIARTGDMVAADAAHRAAAAAMDDDPDGLCAVLCSWLGIALNRQDVVLLLELRERGGRLAAAGHTSVAAAIVATVDAAGMLALGRFAEMEASLLPALTGPVPAPLRGAIAFLRSMGLQARGLFDASVQVLDAEAANLGVFDLAAEMMRARRQWVVGEHLRARSMLAQVHAEARARGRQHDGDFAAAMSRLAARIDGDAPDLPPPSGGTPPVLAMIAAERAVALAADADFDAASAHLLAHPEVMRVAPEFLAVPYVLCPTMRAQIDQAYPGDEPSDALEAARALVAGRAGTPRPVPEPWRLRNLWRPWADELSGGPRISDPAVTAATVRVMGPVSVVVDGQLVAVRRERVRALLSVLALHRRVTRERLIDVLWPDLPPGAGANNLRTTLTYARQLCSPRVLATEGRMVAMAADVDLWRLDAAALAARNAEATCADATVHWCAAADAVGGRFADDVDDAAWLDAARFSADATATNALLSAAGAVLAQQPAMARAYAERALHIDPWNERATVVIAQSWWQQGDAAATRRAALRAHQLIAELGGSPDDELLRLLSVPI